MTQLTLWIWGSICLKAGQFQFSREGDVLRLLELGGGFYLSFEGQYVNSLRRKNRYKLMWSWGEAKSLKNLQKWTVPVSLW